MESELLPCPFCGGMPKVGHANSGVPGMEVCGYAYIECCDVHVHREEDEDCVGAWNTRAPVLREAPAGFVPIPVEPTDEMVSAAEEAYMPFGDMGLAIQMAIAARPQEVKDGE